MQQPDASLSQLQQTAWECDCPVSVKSVTTRLSEPEAAQFMQALLDKALQVSTQSGQGQGQGQSQRASGEGVTRPHLRLPFAQVVLPGGGNQNQAQAGLKVQVLYDWQQGQLQFTLHPAVASDRSLALAPGLATAGSLVVHDSGFLSVARWHVVEPIKSKECTGWRGSQRRWVWWTHMTDTGCCLPICSSTPRPTWRSSTNGCT